MASDTPARRLRECQLFTCLHHYVVFQMPPLTLRSLGVRDSEGSFLGAPTHGWHSCRRPPAALTWPSQTQLVLLACAGGAAGAGPRALGLACGPVSPGGLEVSQWVADSSGWVSRAPTAPLVFLALLAPQGSWWVSVFLLLPALCLLTSDSRPSCPCRPLGPQASCLQSPLLSCPLTGLVSSASSSPRLHL